MSLCKLAVKLFIIVDIFTLLQNFTIKSFEGKKTKKTNKTSKRNKQKLNKYTTNKEMPKTEVTSSQASKLRQFETMTDRLTYLLTGIKSGTTSVAKNQTKLHISHNSRKKRNKQANVTQKQM